MNEFENYIITAANKKYYENLRQLIYSYKRAEEYKKSTLIVYNLGLASKQEREIKKLETKFKDRFFYKHFNFDEYPEFVKPEYNTYSWKPIIIDLVSKEYEGNFLWMDSANCILKELSPIWEEIESEYTFAPISGTGLLGEWTVKETLDYMNVPGKFLIKKNRAGNTFGFSNRSDEVKDLISKWKELALIKECIRPEGANRSNHRDDQSLLTILLLEKEEEGKLSLTNEKVNISTSSPTPYISVRNHFPKFPKFPPGKMAFHYFLLHRFIDIWINRIKGN